MKKIISIIKSIFAKETWIKSFPYNDYDLDCFMCNKITCKDCDFNK